MDVAKAAWLVAKNHRRGLPQMRLLKLLWLAELKHFKETGRRLTPAEWYKWEYGPYSETVVNAVKRDETHFDMEESMSERGRRYVLIRPKAEPPGNVQADEQRTLDDVLWLYKEFTTDEILYDVYGDPFFERTGYGDDFDFSRLAASREYQLTAAEAARVRAQPSTPVQNIAEIFED